MSDKPASTAVRRREFLKVLGAAGATTAAIGCSTEDVGKLIPYVVHPDHTTPGVSNYYATTCRECAASCGLLAETRDGRAFKLEGNPAHPLNKGALCARGQSAVQGLLNPDRWRSPMVRRQPGGDLEPTTWDEALSVLWQQLSQLRAAGMAGQAVFINRHETGALPVFLDQWLAAFGMPDHLSVDALADDAVIEANRQVYGVAWPAFNFAAARLIVSFSADFLDAWGPTVPQQLAWADARAQVENAPRLVYVGPRRSLTGLNADEWIPCRPGHELMIAQAIQQGGAALDQAAQQSGAPADALRRLAGDIATTRPAVVLAGGGGASAHALAMHAATWNQTLGAVGTIVRTDEAALAYDGMTPTAELMAAVLRMSAGQVSFVAVRGANPAFALPAQANFAEAFERVPFKVSFSSYPDETSLLCDLVLPDHHPLESWGLAQPMAGVISIQQPAMDPVFDTRSTPDVLIDVARRDQALVTQFPLTYRDWIFERFPGGMQGFTQAAPTGISSGSVARVSPLLPAGPTAVAAPTAAPPAEGEFYFLVYPSPVLGEGGANKPWLQELADPVSKIAWQSWVEVNPRTARRMAIENGDILAIETVAGRVESPAYIYPGIQENTVAMATGRGHTAYGRFAENIGANPMSAVPVTVDARVGAHAWTVSAARVSKTGRHTPLVTTEGSPRQRDRGIGQAVSVAELHAQGARDPQHPAPAVPGEPALEGQRAQQEEHGGGQPFQPGLRAPVAADAQGALVDPDAHRQGMYRFDHPTGMANRRWAMTIDLARCTGCSACVVACYAENNIPTVGAPYQARNTPGTLGTAGGNILRGREMTWLRLERYWEGPADGGADFEARFVPMLCQHCGNAPCEPVCPVYATYHAPDGLNVQVYNRCVGTRYCSNNCPYKVRYFNWFGYGEPARPQYAWPEPLNWQLNPDVTVRGKGVMEKCTFCVQRIREAENRAALEGRAVNPDEFTTACAQACPSRAIVFGDAADEDWTVAELAHDRRAYHVFEELNTYSAVVYLKKVNHPAPAAPTQPQEV